MIGQNVRAVRVERGMSLATLATLSGLSKGYLSKVERGLANLDTRRSLLDVADALGVSPHRLTGQPYDPQTRQEQTVRTAVADLRDVLYGLTVADGPAADDGPGRDLDALRAAVARVSQLHSACSLDQVGLLLPALLADLHGHAAAGGAARREALPLLVEALHAAWNLAHWAGQPETAYRAAEEAVVAAVEVGDPALLGFARFGMVHSLGHVDGRRARQRAAVLAVRGAEELQPHAAGGPAAEMYGMLHLTAAWSNLLVGDGRDVDAHVAEAAETAKRTGEGTAYRLWFGPTNLTAWRVALAVERGEGGRVPALTAGMNVQALPAQERQAGHLINVGRGLAQEPATAADAVTAFSRARRLTPMRVRLNPLVREVTARLVYDVGTPEVRRFAVWLGVIPR